MTSVLLSDNQLLSLSAHNSNQLYKQAHVFLGRLWSYSPFYALFQAFRANTRWRRLKFFQVVTSRSYHAVALDMPFPTVSPGSCSSNGGIHEVSTSSAATLHPFAVQPRLVSLHTRQLQQVREEMQGWTAWVCEIERGGEKERATKREGERKIETEKGTRKCVKDCMAEIWFYAMKRRCCEAILTINIFVFFNEISKIIF